MTQGLVSRQLHYTTHPEQPDLVIFSYWTVFVCDRRKGGVSLHVGGIHNDKANDFIAV